MRKVDALGLECPIPVVKTKKALEEDDVVEVLVDNDTSVKNLEKMAKQKEYGFKVDKEENHYKITISKNNDTKTTVEEKHKNEKIMKSTIEDITFESPKGYIVVINTDSVGHGDEKLGKILLKSFSYSLTGQDVLPEYILLYNGGVKLTVEDSDSFQDLKDLEEAGVKIKSCGICLDYYDLKDKMSVGEVTNMFRIVELMRTANRVVRP